MRVKISGGVFLMLALMLVAVGIPAGFIAQTVMLEASVEAVRWSTVTGVNAAPAGSHVNVTVVLVKSPLLDRLTVRVMCDIPWAADTVLAEKLVVFDGSRVAVVSFKDLYVPKACRTIYVEVCSGGFCTDVRPRLVVS